MNPLTQVKNLQKITAREVAAGISDDASWHAEFKDSAYVYVGGLPYELTEGDILAVFAQYGEVVDVNLIRDRGTGKSKGFGFLAYEDQRSTVLAVDNLNGAQVFGRTIRVDHVRKYRKKEEEDEEEFQRKREENGVCYEFQRGSCTRGDSCRFSHDPERNKNTGWGAKEGTRWKHDRHSDDAPFRKPADRTVRDEDKKGFKGKERESDEPSRDRYRRNSSPGKYNGKEEIRGDSRRSREERRRSHGDDWDRHSGKRFRDDEVDRRRNRER